MKRHICYISGTRADYGLMKSTLLAINASNDLTLDIIVTGMHLSDSHGYTVSEIKSDSLKIRDELPMILEPATGAQMASNIGLMIHQFVTSLQVNSPDFLLLLGDRGEMLAGAIAAIHLNIPVVHIHGGERSGTVDEPIRHAISKLSHYHFTATDKSRERLIKMGEMPGDIFVTGAPGIDGIQSQAVYSKQQLCDELSLNVKSKNALFVYHPVLQEENHSYNTKLIINTLLKAQYQVIALMPNSDAGNTEIRETLLQFSKHESVRVINHLNRTKFISWLAVSDVMIGNSSSGIIEAGSFGTPVINLGNRQNMRERNSNTVDVEINESELAKALEKLNQSKRYEAHNIYGDGKTAERIVDLLSNLSITSHLLAKSNAY